MSRGYWRCKPTRILVSRDAVLAAVGRAVPAVSVEDVAGCAVPLALASMVGMAAGVEAAGWRETKVRREAVSKLPIPVRV